MNVEPVKIRDGIVMFEGKWSHHLLLESMTSNIYFLEDGDEVIIFDTSCGKEIAKRVEAHIRNRHKAKVEWKKAMVVAGHSHMDHANNFYLSDATGAEETHIYVHENGFRDGKVNNEPTAVFRSVIEECNKYYNFYLSLFFPYNLIGYLFAALDVVAPTLAANLFSIIGGFPWPRPVNGYAQPEPLREEDIHVVDLGDIQVNGWRLGDKVILPTPGHSPCSVSLYWPERKALFVSDAAWVGNPISMDASIKDSISSLQTMKELTEAGKVDLLLTAHWRAKENSEILSDIDFHIRYLETMRNEVLSFYHAHGKEKNVRKLTKILLHGSSFFKMLKQVNYPKFVVFLQTMVAVCLKEEGILVYDSTAGNL